MNNFILFAIHSENYAQNLKSVLESHNINVRLEKCFMGGTSIVVGVKLLIDENDLPYAIKISESYLSNSSLETLDINYPAKKILIPVDLKTHTELACKVGFEIAKRLNLSPVLLHSYLTPIFNQLAPDYDEEYDGGDIPEMEEEYAEFEIGNDLNKQSKVKMMDLRKSIEKKQQTGLLPNIPFTTLINEGIPEDVIKEYCRINKPALIVMATRSKKKKDEELIGSVTAEVLDTCKIPLLSIPENSNPTNIEKIKRIAFFCNLDQNDIICIDSLMRMFDYPEAYITLIPIPQNNFKDVTPKLETLTAYFNKTYPHANFNYKIFFLKNFMNDFNAFETEANIEMLIVPNKRRNIFARLLNPGIAHKLLFERDLPLFAIPV